MNPFQSHDSYQSEQNKCLHSNSVSKMLPPDFQAMSDDSIGLELYCKFQLHWSIFQLHIRCFPSFSILELGLVVVDLLWMNWVHENHYAVVRLKFKNSTLIIKWKSKYDITSLTQSFYPHLTPCQKFLHLGAVHKLCRLKIGNF